MSITRTLTLAGMVAMAMFTAAVAPRSVTAADVPNAVESVQPGAQLVTLDAAGMHAVQGDGFWRKLWRAIVRIAIIIINLPPGCQTLPCPSPLPQPPPLPPIVDAEEAVFDANLAGDVIETFDREVTVNEYYDDDVAFHEGRLSSRSESSTGYVFTGSSGGGGSTCIDPSGPGCQYMY